MDDTVATVCFPFVGDAVGGSHLSAMPLIAGLADVGHESIVVVHQRGPLIPELERQGIRWEPAPGLTSFGAAARTRQLGGVARSVRPMARFLRSRGVAIVHTNDARMHRAWGIASRLGGVRHVWHQRNAGLSWKMAQVARLADDVLAVSEFARIQLPPHLARRTHVVDNPFDTTVRPDRTAARAMLATELGVHDDVAIITFAGALIPRKRPEVFVDIAGELVTRGVDAVFPMFGAPDGPLASSVSARIHHLALGDRVHMVGFRSPIEPWLAASDVLVAPSLSEPFARTVIESMIVGTPVVAADDGGNREIIVSGVNGVLVPPDDTVAFADHVEGLLDDHVRRQSIADAAHDAVHQRFSIERHVAVVSERYRALLR